MAEQVKNAGLAVASLILGIASFVCVGIFAAVPAVICGHMAKTKIREAGGALAGDGMALAGLILGYVNIGLSVILIPVYLGLMLPAVAKARDAARGSVCINNLRLISHAKEAAAIKNNLQDGAQVTPADVNSYIDGGFDKLKCPQGGTYTLNPVGKAPECSVPGHKYDTGE
jgi:hypothetical protein